MNAKFHVIYVSDKDLLASYARQLHEYVWEFTSDEQFNEWLQYAILSDQVAGMLHWPSGRMTHIAINREIEGK